MYPLREKRRDFHDPSKNQVQLSSLSCQYIARRNIPTIYNLNNPLNMFFPRWTLYQCIISSSLLIWNGVTCSLAFVQVNVTGNNIISEIPNFWSSTGISLLGSHDRLSRLLSSNDMAQNLGLIGSLPSFTTMREVKVDWLLDLISLRRLEDNYIDYRFDHLDDFIQLLYENNLKPGFKLMGNPSNFFSNFEDETQAIILWDLVKSIATRYSSKYGSSYVSSWNFETWARPDSNEFDGLTMTLDGFLNYFEASYQGLASAASLLVPGNSSSTSSSDKPSVNFQLRLGGPGGRCPGAPTTNSSFCWTLIERMIKKVDTSQEGGYLESEPLKIFFSLQEHEKRELQTVKEIQSRLSSLREVEVGSTIDVESSWSFPRTWRADASYAAFVAKSVASKVKAYYTQAQSTPKVKFISLHHDNAHLSHFPNQFTQRTLLARFQINNTFPPFVRFVKKPVYLATGLVGLLGDQILDIQRTKGFDSQIDVIPTSSYDQIRDEKVYSFLAVNSLADPTILLPNGSVKLNLTLNLSFSDLNNEWKIARYSVDNGKTNPFNVWKEHGSRPFFTYRVLHLMRAKSELSIDPPSNLNIIPSSDGFDQQTKISVNMPFPSVSLILICSKARDGPSKVTNLRAITINEFEMLLLWSPSKSRCVKTFEVEFADINSLDTFDKINEDAVIFSSFNVLRYTHSIPSGQGIRYAFNATGDYRVREVDFFGRTGEYSEVLRYRPHSMR